MITKFVCCDARQPVPPAECLCKGGQASELLRPLHQPTYPARHPALAALPPCMPPQTRAAMQTNDPHPLLSPGWYPLPSSEPAVDVLCLAAPTACSAGGAWLGLTGQLSLPDIACSAHLAHAQALHDHRINSDQREYHISIYTYVNSDQKESTV